MNKLTIIISIGIIFIQSCATQQSFREKYPAQYLKNQKIQIAVFPLQNDSYGATDMVISQCIEDGYRVIERQELNKVFEEIKLQMSGITESEAIKCGKILNVDYIVLGSVFIAPEKPEKPKEISPGLEILAAFISPSAVEERDKKILDYKAKLKNPGPGKCVYANYRRIKVETGQIVNIVTDYFVRGLGSDK